MSFIVQNHVPGYTPMDLSFYGSKKGTIGEFGGGGLTPYIDGVLMVDDVGIAILQSLPNDEVLDKVKKNFITNAINGVSHWLTAKEVEQLTEFFQAEISVRGVFFHNGVVVSLFEMDLNKVETHNLLVKSNTRCEELDREVRDYERKQLEEKERALERIRGLLTSVAFQGGNLISFKESL